MPSFRLLIVAVSLFAAAHSGAFAQSKLAILQNLPTFQSNDQTLSAPLRKALRVDAARLAIRLLSKEQKLEDQAAQIPQNLHDALYHALVAIYAQNSPEIQEIEQTYGIRTFPRPAVEGLTILLEEEQLAELSPDAQKKLLAPYGLVPLKAGSIDGLQWGLIANAPTPINVPAAQHLLYVKHQLPTAEEILASGDGHDIRAERLKTGGWRITFRLGFGKCVNKCDAEHTWIFEVSDQGESKFISRQGNNIPPWLQRKSATTNSPSAQK